MASTFRVLVALLSVVGFTEVFSDCPADASQRLQTCMAGIMQATMSNAGSGAPGVMPIDQMKQICEGVGSTTISCMRELIDACPDAGLDTHYLDKMEDAIGLMCDDIDVLVEQSECIGGQTDNLQTCIQTKGQAAGMGQPQSEPQGEPSEQDQCKAMELVFDCTKEVFGTQCSQKTASIMEGAIRLALPDSCSYILKSSDVTKATVTLAMLVLCSVVAFLLK